MKREDGMLVSSKEEVKGILKRHFECLMNGGEAIVTSMGMEASEKGYVSREYLKGKGRVSSSQN